MLHPHITWGGIKRRESIETLYGSHTGLRNLLQASYTLYESQNEPNSENFFKLPACFEAVKTYSPNIYKPPTPLAVLKIDPPKFYKLPSLFELLRASYTFCCSQNRLLRLIKASSLVPQPKEEKGPGFSRSRMRLIISELTTCWSVGGCHWRLQSHTVDCMTLLFTISNQCGL